MAEQRETPTFEELTQPVEDGQATTTDPAYNAWLERTVAEALAEADAHPDQCLTLAQVWKRFGHSTH